MSKIVTPVKINQRSRRTKPTTYSTSVTIPGQSLKPAEMLKRHLAGTLPDIDLSARYEYHYDDQGKQVSEPLPLEMHEVHKLAVALRQRQYEEAIEQKKRNAEKLKEQIIDEYVKQNPKKFKAPEPTPKPTTPSPKTSKAGSPSPEKGSTAL